MYRSTLDGEELVTKKCNKCGEHKVLSDFATRTKDRKESFTVERRNECKDCRNKLSRQRNKLTKYHAKPDSDYTCPCCGRGAEEINCNGWVLDHDHSTGEFRGWLCDDCNGALGKALDNPKTLRRLADYLERSLVISSVSVDVFEEFEKKAELPMEKCNG